MFYYYLRFINYLFTIFGIRKPFLSYNKTPSNILLRHRLWSAGVIACVIVIYIFTMKSSFKFSLKTNINLFYETNDVVINILIIILNMGTPEHLVKLYEGLQKILQDFKISEINVKLISLKVVLVFVGPTVTLIFFIILEIFKEDALILLITLPAYLSTFHLVLHLFLLLAILKLITTKMSDLLSFEHKMQHNNFIEKLPNKINKAKYLIGADISFFVIDRQKQFDLKHFCKIYDDISTCLKLLEQHHGVQILLTFWLMLTNGVFGITMIVCNNADPVLVVSRSFLPFFWCFLGCLINDQISNQVEQIDMIIIKFLIDFRCDCTRKNILQTFKQLVGVNRLQFTACGLFHLNYSMILNTFVNIFTYSIILIQLFISDD